MPHKHTERVLDISIPTSHKLSGPADGMPIQERDIFRSRATAALKEAFQNNCWTLRETRSPDRLELRVFVKAACFPEFRAKIAELGFSEHR